MNKTRILSLLLCLCMLCTLILPAAAAEGETPTDNGMKVSKTATANPDGSYTITLEAFATGKKTTTLQTKDVPTDIILVLDQSGSMEEDIGQVQYTQYTGNNTQNKKNYENRHNSGSANLWHKLNDDSFVSVSVTKATTYRQLGSLVNYETDWQGKLTTSCYSYYAENLYEKVGDEYKKITLTEKASGKWYEQKKYTYTYTFSDGTSTTSVDRNATPDLKGHGPLYTTIDAPYVYTYTYTDTEGKTQTIGTPSVGDNTVFTPAFYRRNTTSGGGSRIAALKNAANTFANEVAKKAAGADGNINTSDDNINHRIAVVGYACGEWYNYSYYNYKNTEVFIGSTQYKYGNAAQGQYSNAFQSMTTSSGVSNVNASINALEADGGTLTNLGLEMANGIFAKNPIGNGEKRNRVVILFTDGEPGWSGYSDNVANSAITQASTAKNTYGATVYSIGIFAGADATSPGNASGNGTEKANWFMQNVSSNNGNPRTPSYYLSAGDAASLNNIFQQISNNITTGGSSTTLGSETVVKDIISPYFTLPAGTTADNIQINTYGCTGKNGDNYTWSSTSSGNDGATATVNGDQVSVTGFNFSENWCGTETDANGTTTVRGKKLVISFNVKPKDGFLGGNGVPTNANAGVYENSTATAPVVQFQQPTVNVPIKNVTVTAQDKNVYLLGTVTAEQLKEGATVTVGNVPLDLSKANDATNPYGLVKWQTEHVKITVTVKDANGQAITNDLKNLTADAKYTIEVKVEPLPDAVVSDQGTTATAQTNSGDANINVFKPELTFKDSEGYYGEAVPNEFNDNKVGTTQWKHNASEAVQGQMIGTEPQLTITYTPDNSKIHENKLTKQDIPVKAEVKIGDLDVTGNTTFVHQACTPACSWTDPTTPGDPAFLIHVNTCTLKVIKSGGADNEPYVFTVNKDGTPYTEVTIVGNKSQDIVELPVGTYTIAEDTGWSWRYPNPNYSASVTLSKDSTDGTITCTNNKTLNKWLNGFSAVKPNIFKQTATNN